MIEEVIMKVDIVDISKRYFELKPEFEWFLKEYYKPEVILELDKLAYEESPRLLTVLNNIWLTLPDSKFNVVENPKGWDSFLSLIEI